MSSFILLHIDRHLVFSVPVTVLLSIGPGNLLEDVGPVGKGLLSVLLLVYLSVFMPGLCLLQGFSV